MEKLYCDHCGTEVRVGEQTDYAECIEYRDHRGGIVCKQCEGSITGCWGTMILPRMEAA